LSGLTKILIILLTLASIFLCGIVVTYVANAGNYRDKYTTQRTQHDALSRKVSGLNKQLDEKIKQKDELEKKLNDQIAALKIQTDELQVGLKSAQREKAKLEEKVNSWVTVVESFTATAKDKQALLDKTLEELNTLKQQQIKDRKQLAEANTALVEKMAIIETLDTEKKRLVEEKSDLQNRMDKLLQSGGRVAAVSAPVTPQRGIARPAEPLGVNIALKGLISGVDLKNSWASISIGSADGVKQGMRFHVTRGSDFICDLLIIDVDTDKALGVLELVQQPPKVGDNVSTNL